MNNFLYETQRFADIEFTTENCRNFINCAIEHRKEVVEYDEDGFIYNYFEDVNSQDDYGSTVLMICGKINRDNFSRIEATKMLIEAGADVNLFDDCKRTALMRSKHVDFTEFLLKNGADFNAVDCDGKTALFPYSFYLSSYDPAIVDLLVTAGANVNHQDFEGKTALICSLNLKLSERLIANGADVNRHDKDGLTALMNFAYALEHDDAMLKHIDLLIKSGADISEILNSTTVIIKPNIRSYIENASLNKVLITNCALKNDLNMKINNDKRTRL